MQSAHEHRFRPQPPGSLSLRQFVESLRRWSPEMRQVAQIAITRTPDERAGYLRAFHTRHHERSGGEIDSFVRWAYSDPRIDYVPQLLAELERGDADFAGALEHEADVLVRLRGEHRTPARRVADFLELLGIEGSEQIRESIAKLLPPDTPESVVISTIRLMRRRWLELYGDDPFFAED